MLVGSPAAALGDEAADKLDRSGGEFAFRLGRSVGGGLDRISRWRTRVPSFKFGVPMTVTLSATEYRLLVEHSPVMIWRAGTDARCDYFNDTWLAYTGRTLEQEAGDGWAQGVHLEDLERCVAHYLDHFHRRAPFEMEYRLRRHDGVYRWIFDRGVPFTDDAGHFAGYVGSCVDVDDRRRAQAAREQRDRQQLDHAREFEQWILAIVGHDIRNPLGAIDSAARLIALRPGSDASAGAIAERITRSARRITNIVGDLLDLSRERHGGGIPIARAPVDLAAICREVADEITTTATDRTVSIECDGDGSGTWDRNRLMQAVSNLVGNAVQHSPAGSPVLMVVRDDADRVRLDVHNEGAIPDHLLESIFEPFRSGGGAPKGRTGGLGLGLFIARAIASAHGGNIDVESSPERGTTFRLALPRGASANGGSHASSAA